MGSPGKLTMRSEAVPISVTAISRHYSQESNRRTHRRWMTMLLVAITLAVLTGGFGLALAAVSLLQIIAPYGRLAFVGTALLAVTFPILVFAAHCLDRIEDANRVQRMASYRRLVYGEVEAESAGDN